MCPQCIGPGCPSYCAIFKKMFNCVKVVMFGAMIFVVGRSNFFVIFHIISIYMLDFVVINTSYK